MDQAEPDVRLVDTGPIQKMVAVATTPIAESLRTLTGGLTKRAPGERVVPVEPVPCPRCGSTLAVLDPSTRRLHRVVHDRLGPAMGADHRSHIAIRCDACEVTRETSGRTVALRLHSGRPLLPRAGIPGEFDQVRLVLEQRGVSGTADFGYFVDIPELFRPSEFDERAAMPVLLELLPTLTDGRVVAATARHLRRPWARPTAFVPLAEAFRKWAPSAHADAGWALGDAAASAAGANDSEMLLSLAKNPAYGTARQMIVPSLWRFRRDEKVLEALPTLAGDPDVSLQALSVLRRAIGKEAALRVIRDLAESSPHEKVREQASRELRKAERASHK